MKVITKEMASVWDNRFLELSEQVASWSKDPSTKVGCLIVSSDKRIIGQGFNGFPKKMLDDGRLFDKVEKHRYIIHAEENALLNPTQPMQGATAYVWPLHPCPRCAAKLVQVGIAKVVANYPSEKHSTTYELAEVAELFKECGIEFILISTEAPK